MKTALQWVLLLAISVFCGPPGSAQKKPPRPASPRLHVVYLLNQEDSAFGLLNLVNEEFLTQITKTVEWALSYPAEVTYLSKGDFTQAALNQTITALKTRPKDIIIVYYAGFGVLSSASGTGNFANWKLNDAPGRGVAVAEVEKWLWAKPAHLRLLVADCSAQFVPIQERSAMVTSQPDLRKQVIRRLFLATCGLVKLGSSLPIAPSWATGNQPGSLFTRSLSAAFQDLLLTRTSTALSRISFQQLTRLTAGHMQQTLNGTPFNQAPVLEVQSCARAAQSVVQRTKVDPLVTETLNGLLNTAAATRDSLQRVLIHRKILAVIPADAPVAVSRLVTSSAGFQQEEPALFRQTTLGDYLEGLQKPLSYIEAGVVYEISATLMKLYVTEKTVDASTPKRIRRLLITEEYTKTEPSKR